MVSNLKLEVLEKEIESSIKHLKFMRKMAILEKEIENFYEEKKLFKSGNFNKTIINGHCVAIICELEILLCLKNLHYSKSDMESRHLLKNGLLRIFETISTLNKMSKSYKPKSDKYSRFLVEFQKHTDNLRDFKKSVELENRIKSIRNNISGHITSDFIKYSEILDSIDIDNDILALQKFQKILNSLNVYLYKCFREDLDLLDNFNVKKA